MALVEPVPGEVRHQVEDLLRLFRRVPPCGGPFDEHGFLLGHFGSLLFAHRSPQQIGATERVACHLLRDLHDLLLIDNDTPRLSQDAFERRVRVVDLLPPVLAVDEVLVHLRAHRSRPIERDRCDDVVESVRSKLLEEALHAARFELKHVGGLAGLQQRIGRVVVHGDLVDAKWLVLPVGPPVDQFRRHVDHRQGAKPEEIELHQARRFDIILVVLRDVDVFFRAEHRHVVPNRPLAHDDACRVHARVSCEVFERLCGVEELTRLAVLLVRRFEPRLLLERVADRHALAAHRLRDQCRDQAGFTRRHAHDAPHVAHDASALELMKRRDLAHAGVPIFVAHVLNDAVPLIHAEVDVEVGHRHALGVEKALEKKAMGDGIQVGDAKRPRHQRAGATPTARAHGHTVVFCPVDEVLHDQEVTREPHLQDHVELELKPMVIGVLFKALATLLHLEQSTPQPRNRERAQVILFGRAAGHGKTRQVRLGEGGGLPGAHLGDQKRVFRRFGDLSEQVQHLLGRFEIELGRVMVHRFHLADAPPSTDALQYELRVCGPTLEVITVVGRHDR